MSRFRELARERTPPVEWMLWTTLPVENLTTAETVVRYDTYRWRVQRHHYVLKRGCHIEDLPLETFDRLDRALAV